jgi:hypothetical protein
LLLQVLLQLIKQQAWRHVERHAALASCTRLCHRRGCTCSSVAVSISATATRTEPDADGCLASDAHLDSIGSEVAAAYRADNTEQPQ